MAKIRECIVKSTEQACNEQCDDNQPEGAKLGVDSLVEAVIRMNMRKRTAVDPRKARSRRALSRVLSQTLGDMSNPRGGGDST